MSQRKKKISQCVVTHHYKKLVGCRFC